MMNELMAALSQKGRSVNITGLRGSASAYCIAQAASDKKPILCIAPSEATAQHLCQDLALFTDTPVLHYPGYEIPPYTPLSPDSQTVSDRLASLYQVINASEGFLLVVSAEALLRRTLPRERIANLADLVLRGEDMDPDDLIASLSGAGYEAANLVQNVGEFSRRGGILDIFPPGFDLPIRLDFFGDTVESIRKFEPISQRSVDDIEEAVLLPVSDILFPQDEAQLAGLGERFTDLAARLDWDEDRAYVLAERLAIRQRFPGIEFFQPLFYEQSATLFDYLPADTLIFFSQPGEIQKSIDLTRERIAANFKEASQAKLPALPPADLFVESDELTTLWNRHGQVRFYDFAHTDMLPGEEITVSCGNHALLKQNIELKRQKQGLLPALAVTMREWMQNGDRILLACRSQRHAEHMGQLLDQHQFETALCPPPLDPNKCTAEQVGIYPSALTAGFDLASEKLHILSESELFGELRLGKKRKKTASRPAINFEELNLGDVVVHRTHGLGIYQGIINLELRGVANDFLLLSYQGDDKLYVPVDQLSVVSKYKGISDKEPKLDKLGSKAWQTRNKKVKEEVWKVAQELLNLYARRAIAEGHAFSPPDEMFRELEESFPYDETPGQLKAINDVLNDLTAEQPMDRLVCGDVGYGKTEVAVRGAFKVVLDNYQVAILVPTTVLAEQHAETFRERLRGFPVRVESLTRFRTTTEQKKTVQELAAGKIDIIIGTQRLLSQDVKFRRLGLLIVDEEHRFGVAHKEKLKKLKSRVDVLTLTATPIPRTLQLSLLNIRDLSVISSPPEHRRPVKTFVARHDDLVIKEAIVREMQRGGQVFLVHNRVHSIYELAAKAQELVPEARVAVAHGQMPGKVLEEIMVKFVRGEVDVLICTTIIESGLDIPNANTIIITRADRLGLAEIYQLRGRVGRGRDQAYAYLLVPSLDGLSKDAQQRLRALMDYNELGGGFKLAMSDLQIRGGGNILGISQSGNIAAVGYDLYLELLQQTVQDLKRRQQTGEEQESFEIEPEINLSLSAYLPEHYIPATDQRYIAYRRLTSVFTPNDLLELEDEFRDRYGALPQETENLFTVMQIKIQLRSLRIMKLEQGAGTLVFSFHESTPIKPEKVLRFMDRHKNQVRFTPEARLIVKTGEQGGGAGRILADVQNILHALMEDDN